MDNKIINMTKYDTFLTFDPKSYIIRLHNPYGHVVNKLLMADIKNNPIKLRLSIYNVEQRIIRYNYTLFIESGL